MCPGVDPSGVITAIGEGVTSRKVGDRVAASIRLAGGVDVPPTLLGVQAWGGYAEYVKVPATATHIIPDNVDFATATCVVRHAPTAFHLLRDRASSRPANGCW